MLLSKPKKIALALLTTIVLVQSVSANDYRTEEEVNQMCIDRYDIEEVQEEEYIEIECELSYYTTLNSENGYGAIDAQGNSLKFGTIAIPREIDLGTEFSFDVFEGVRFTGTDRGSKKHIRITSDGIYRMDVCIERNKGETDEQYWSRVNALGKTKTKGKMYIKE